MASRGVETPINAVCDRYSLLDHVGEICAYVQPVRVKACMTFR